MTKVVHLEIAGLMDPTHATGTQHPLVSIEVPLLRKCLNRARSSDASAAPCFGRLDWGEEACARTGVRHLGLADTEEGFWLRADLVEMQPDTHALYVMGNRHLHLMQDELTALAGSINELLNPLAAEWYPVSSCEGYLRVQEPPQVAFVPLLDALLRDQGRTLPTGPERRTWERLGTEIQMALHAHPVNQARQERGSAPANSLYIWGGCEPSGSEGLQGTDLLVSDSNMVLGMAPTSTATAMDQNWLAVDLDSHSRITIVLTELMWLRRQGLVADWQQRVLEIQRQWLAPLITSLEREEIAEVHMYFGGSRRFVLNKRYWRRFWKWNRPIGDWLRA